VNRGPNNVRREPPFQSPTEPPSTPCHPSISFIASDSGHPAHLYSFVDRSPLWLRFVRTARGGKHSSYNQVATFLTETAPTKCKTMDEEKRLQCQGSEGDAFKLIWNRSHSNPSEICVLVFIQGWADLTSRGGPDITETSWVRGGAVRYVYPGSGSGYRN
jgi:hypothetical protein